MNKQCNYAMRQPKSTIMQGSYSSDTYVEGAYPINYQLLYHLLGRAVAVARRHLRWGRDHEDEYAKFEPQ